MFGIDDAIAGAIIGGGLNIAGDMMSQSNARDAFKTRYQDTVKDMRAAGLNPALAYGQGGGNPQTMSYGDWGSSAAQAAQAAAQAKKTRAETDLLNAQKTDLISQAAVRTTYLNRLAEQAGAGADVNTARAALLNLGVRREKATLDSDIAAALALNLQTQLQTPEARARAKYYSQLGPAAFYLNNAIDVGKTVAQLRGAAALGRDKPPYGYTEETTRRNGTTYKSRNYTRSY